jgi:glutathione S-transferase
MNIELYYAPQTRSIRPRWLLEELELPYMLHEMELFDETMRSREYRRIHPLGQIPALRIDGEIMIESVAMCHWLADQFLEKGLAPKHDSDLRKAYEQ